jgi:hypothetical protein
MYTRVGGRGATGRPDDQMLCSGDEYLRAFNMEVASCDPCVWLLHFWEYCETSSFRVPLVTPHIFFIVVDNLRVSMILLHYHCLLVQLAVYTPCSLLCIFMFISLAFSAVSERLLKDMRFEVFTEANVFMCGRGCHVALQMGSNFWEEPAASVFGVELKWQRIFSEPLAFTLTDTPICHYQWVRLETCVTMVYSRSGQTRLRSGHTRPTQVDFKNIGVIWNGYTL